MSRPRRSRATSLEQVLAQVERLERRVSELEAENSQLKRRVAELETENERLRENLGATSHNSSKPPSSDPASMPRHERKSSGRTHGAQKGHEGHHRALVPPECVDEVKTVVADRCKHCESTRLEHTGTVAWRQQVAEVPEVRPHVTEYQGQTCRCRDCGRLTESLVPRHVAESAFGPRAHAVVSFLTGACHLSRRTAQDAIRVLFGLEMSLGSVSACEQTVSQALSEPVAHAELVAQEQPVGHADETGWRQTADESGTRRKSPKAWLWVFATALVTVFKVREGRGHAAATALMGRFRGILVSDRWVVYERWSVWMRQLCWAHLKRAFVKFSERKGNSKGIGEALIEQTDLMFHWWHKVRDGTLKRQTFQRYMRGLRPRVEELLRQGRDLCTHSQTRGSCGEILRLAPALWTFVRELGVEPTNNAGERPMRKGVMWRRTSHGSFSDSGSRFVERMLTVTETLRQQGRDTLSYLTRALTAHQQRQPIPALVHYAIPIGRLAA